MMQPQKSEVKKLIWSKMPMDAYVVRFDGEMIGPASLPHMQLPGVWNIHWLLIEESIEGLTHYKGKPGEFPIEFAVTPAVVGTSIQKVDGKSLGQWAEELTPKQWLKKAAKLDQLILEAVHPQALELAAINAEKYQANKGNIVHLNLHRMRKQN